MLDKAHAGVLNDLNSACLLPLPLQCIIESIRLCLF